MGKDNKKPFETELTDDEMMEMTGGSSFIPVDGSISGIQPITMKYGIKVLRPLAKYGIPVTDYGIQPKYGVSLKYGVILN